MKLIRQIDVNFVLWEWLKAEWYKDPFNNIRDEYSYLVKNPNFENYNENGQRKSIMLQLRPDVIKPLLELPFVWYIGKFENYDEFKDLYIITSDDWYLVTNKSFKLSQTVNNLHHNQVHESDVREKLNILRNKGSFEDSLILGGRTKDKMTIIEGNHRAITYLHYNDETNSNVMPDQVIVGLCSYINQYRWSVEWDGMPWLFQECERKFKGN